MGVIGAANGLVWHASHLLGIVSGIVTGDGTGSMERFTGYNLTVRVEHEGLVHLLRTTLKIRNNEQALGSLKTAVAEALPGLDLAGPGDFDLLYLDGVSGPVTLNGYGLRTLLRGEQERLDAMRYRYSCDHPWGTNPYQDNTLTISVRVQPRVRQQLLQQRWGETECASPTYGYPAGMPVAVAEPLHEREKAPATKGGSRRQHSA